MLGGGVLGGGVLGGGVLGGGFIYLYEPRCESGARRVGELERTHWIGRGHLAADDRVRLPRTRLPIRENRPVVPCAEGARRESDGSRGCVSNLCVELAEDLRMGQVPKKTGEVRHTEHMLRCLGVGGGYGGTPARVASATGLPTASKMSCCDVLGVPTSSNQNLEGGAPSRSRCSIEPSSAR